MRCVAPLVALVVVVMVTARAAAECAHCPRCAPPPARCRYHVSPGTRDEHFYTIDGVSTRIEFTDAYLKLTCEAGLSLESASLPRFPQRARVSSVVLVACPAPRGSYRRALDALNVSVLDALELQRVPHAPPLRADHLAGLHLLQSLTVSAELGRVLDPDPGLLNPLRELRKLWLTSVRLQPTAVGSLPSSLTTLRLFDCELRDIAAPALTRLTALTLLMLRDDTLTAAPPLDAAPALRSVSIDAPLLELPPFDRLENVTLTKVRNVTLRGSCDSLQRLSVRSSGLSSLPAGWLRAGSGGVGARCPRLRELRLMALRVAVLPVGLLASTALRELTVTQCRTLRALPDDLFVGTRHLRRLVLTYNALTDLPHGIFAPLRELEELNLAYNKLRDSAPGGATAGALVGVGALTSLRTLVLDHNELGDTCGRTTGGVTGTELSPLWQLRELRSLSLAHTGASRLCVDWRRDLHELTTINFSFNNLTVLRHTDMQWYGSRREVELLGNPLRDVFMWRKQYETLSDDATSNVTLQFNANINCTCHTYWMARALRERRLRASLVGVTCGGSDTALASAPLASMTCDEPALCDTNCTCALHPGDTDTVVMRCRGRRELPDLTRAAQYAPRVELHLAGNSVARLPATLPARLQLLDLRNNSIAVLSASAAAALFAHSRRVLLAGNPLNCACDVSTRAHPALLRELLEHSHLALDLSDLTCAETGMRVRDTPPCEESVASLQGLGLWLGAAGGVAAGVVLALVLVRVAARRGGKLRVKAFLLARGLCATWARPNDDDDSKYDVFISFSRHDFSIAEQIVSELESGPRPLRVCVHYRDWRPGDWIPAQIARSVRLSRRTLVLVSEHFVRSTWARAEFREATARALRDSEPRLLVVLLQPAPPTSLDSELRHYITSNTYLRWGEPAFWDRLRLALPPGRPRDTHTPPPAGPSAAPPAPQSAADTQAAPPAPPAPFTQQPSPTTPIIKFSQMDLPSPIKKHVAETSPCA